MTNNDTIDVRIAMEIERKTVGSAEHWTEDELRSWCFNDPFGKRSFKASLAIANHILSLYDVKERRYDGFKGNF